MIVTHALWRVFVGLVMVRGWSGQENSPMTLAVANLSNPAADILRMWYEKIDAWILEQAGIEFNSEEEKPALQAIK